MQQINNQSQSAALADYIKKQGNNSSPKPQVAEAKTDEIKEEAVENKGKISFTGNKKKAAIIGGVAALAIAGIGIAAVVIKHGISFKINSLEKSARALAQNAQEAAANANKMADETPELATEAYNLVNEAQAAINNAVELFRRSGLDADGKQIGAIEEIARNQRLMTETLEGGITRESSFVGDTLSRIEELLPDGKKNVIVFDLGYGRLASYEKGFEQLADGGHKAAQKIHFENNGILSYQKGFEELIDGGQKAAQKIEIGGGEAFTDVVSYQKGFEKLADGSEKATEKIFLNPAGECDYYCKGLELLSDGSQKIDESMYFNYDNTIREYNKGSKAQAETGWTTEEKIHFRDNKITRYIKDEKKPDFAVSSTGEMLDFTLEEKPCGYYKNFDGLNRTVEEAYRLEDGKWVNITELINNN